MPSVILVLPCKVVCTQISFCYKRRTNAVKEICAAFNNDLMNRICQTVITRLQPLHKASSIAGCA